MMRTASTKFGFHSTQRLRMARRAGVLGLAIALAFLAGKFFGHVRYGDSLEDDRMMSASQTSKRLPRSASPAAQPDEAMSEWALATVYSSVGRVASAQAGPVTNRRLRLRSVSRISSGEAQAGERVTFVTAEAIEDVAGQRLPAGSRVEGIIAQATEAGEGAGRLVIEIHSLHVGGRSLALKALPIAALGGRPIRTQRPEETATKQWRQRLSSLNPLNQAPRWTGDDQAQSSANSSRGVPAPTIPDLREAPALREAIVPQESILEFELLALPAIAPEAQPAVEESQPKTSPTVLPWRPGPRVMTARG